MRGKELFVSMNTDEKIKDIMKEIKEIIYG